MVKMFTTPKEVFRHYQDKEYYSTFIRLTNKCLTLFEYSSIPDSLDVRSLELYLILVGNVAITKQAGKYHILNGNVGITYNENYQPLKYIGSNPYYKKQDYQLNIGEDSILFCNSYLDRWTATGGLRYLIESTSQLLSENMASLNILQKNSRVMPIITTETDNARKVVDNVLQDMYMGRPYKCISNNLINDIKVNTILSEATSGNLITKLIELQQYVKASFLNELGINSNYNMKRERLNSAEVDTNDDSLFFNIENMLSAREKSCEEFNKLFNENITVKLNDSWYKKDKKVNSNNQQVIEVKKTYDNQQEGV